MGIGVIILAKVQLDTVFLHPPQLFSGRSFVLSYHTSPYPLHSLHTISPFWNRFTSSSVSLLLFTFPPKIRTRNFTLLLLHVQNIQVIPQGSSLITPQVQPYLIYIVPYTVLSWLSIISIASNLFSCPFLASQASLPYIVDLTTDLKTFTLIFLPISAGGTKFF